MSQQQYFIPASQTITLPSGRPYKLIRGIHPIPHELADHADAIKLGIKTMSEMTDADYRSIGMKRPAKA